MLFHTFTIFKITGVPPPIRDEHFCLGASLARMEIRIFCEEIVPRLDCLELGGRPERLASTFIGGIKHLPIRFRVRAISR